MSAADQLFQHPIAPELVSQLHSLFATAAARLPPITHVLVWLANPWPLPEEMLQVLGKGQRPMLRAGSSERTEPPSELIFGQREAWGRYEELAGHANAKDGLLLFRHDEWKHNAWTFTLYSLARDEAAAVSFRAPYKLTRYYPSRASLTVLGKPDQAWPLIQSREQAEGLSGHVAEVYYCKLSDLWAASVETLDVWNKRGAAPIGQAASIPESVAIPSHSDDFRSVHWFGKDYAFTATQAACISVLWKAWQQGTPEMSHEAILDRAGSAGSRLRDVFDKGRHPAWGTLIAKGSRKGSFRLTK